MNVTAILTVLQENTVMGVIVRPVHVIAILTVVQENIAMGVIARCWIATKIGIVVPLMGILLCVMRRLRVIIV